MKKKKKVNKRGNRVHNRPLAQNRKAAHFYNILETYEAGISLLGCEVKSIRDSRINISEGFAKVENGEIFLYKVHIDPYQQARLKAYEPTRKRKLLLHKNEIKKLIGATQSKGMTILPLKVYFKKNWAKVLVGLAKAKHLYDKRQKILKKIHRREMREKKGI